MDKDGALLRAKWLKAIQSTSRAEAEAILGPEQSKRLPKTAAVVLAEEYIDIEQLVPKHKFCNIPGRCLGCNPPLKFYQNLTIARLQRYFKKKARMHRVSVYLEHNSYLLKKSDLTILQMYSEGATGKQIIQKAKAQRASTRSRTNKSILRHIRRRLEKFMPEIDQWFSQQRQNCIDTPEDEEEVILGHLQKTS